MNNEVRALAPNGIWDHFADLNAVPRPSKKEERVIKFIEDFGNSLGLETIKDETGNVIIKKPASKGMEKRMPIILQSHLDMVHQKNADTKFDFDKEGIQMVVDGDWVKAKGTTLGADNGIGVASIMTILASKEIKHPAIEALFTIDEETGMTGALNLKPGSLHGNILLNLDTEDDHELTIGCAGGVDVTATGSYSYEGCPKLYVAFIIHLKGLTGGHSGMDIHKGRANANKLMNRLLSQASDLFKIRVCSIDGGSLRNAIPRESFAEVIVPEEETKNLTSFIEEQLIVLKEEYHTTDPNLLLQLEKIEIPAKVLSQDFQNKLLRSIYASQNGIYRMSPEIEGLVQSSNNIARVLVKDGTYSIQCLTRSAVDSEKMDLANSLRASFELIGAKVTFSGAYPGWAPKPEANIVKIMSDLYKKKFKSEPNVNACHAGLECGIIGAHYPEMEMISFGPNILGAHSPDEKVQISSVNKYWEFLLDILKAIPSEINS